MTALVATARRSTLLRSLGLLAAGTIVLLLITNALSDYNNLQLAYGAYYFATLAGLTMLAGRERADLARPRRADGGRRVHGCPPDR